MLLSVSATEASVEHAQAKPLATKQLFPLVGLLPVLIEQGVRQSEDQKTAEVTARTVPKAWCEQIMRDVFQDELTGKRGILLQDVQAPPTPTEHQQFLSEGYSAFLSLALVDLSLRWTTGDVAAMHAEVHGQLTEFASGRLAWNRYESAMSAQSYPIDRYLANQGELLRSVAEGLLRKVMVRLTYDFVYAQ